MRDKKIIFMAPALWILIFSTGKSAFNFNPNLGSGEMATQTEKVFGTNFDPMDNGFKFDNDWKEYGFFEKWGLCGGMVFTALDFYYAGCSVSHYDRPSKRSLLYQHIWARQFPLSATYVASKMTEGLFWQAVSQFMGPENFWQAAGQLLEANNRAQNNAAYEKIRETISSVRPVAIGLVGETGQPSNSHVVLGYEISEIFGKLQKAVDIKVYDPNRPLSSNSTISISWNLKTGRMEKIRLTENRTEWVELLVLSYKPQALPDMCDKHLSGMEDILINISDSYLSQLKNNDPSLFNKLDNLDIEQLIKKNPYLWIITNSGSILLQLNLQSLEMKNLTPSILTQLGRRISISYIYSDGEDIWITLKGSEENNAYRISSSGIILESLNEADFYQSKIWRRPEIIMSKRCSQASAEAILDAGDRIWVAYFKGSVCSIDKVSAECKIVYSPGTYDWPTSLALVKDYIFMGTLGRGLAIYNLTTGKLWENVIGTVLSLKKFSVINALESHEKYLWLGMPTGLFRLDVDALSKLLK